jgi:hypothetical protein
LKLLLAPSTKLNEEELLLISVTVRGELVVPTATVPNATVVGEMEIGATPAPAVLTNDGVLESELLMVISPGIEPVSEGLNVTLIAQLPLGCKVVPKQVLL